MNKRRQKLIKTGSKCFGLATVVVAMALDPAGHAALYNFTTSGDGVYTASASGLNQVIPDYDPSGVAYGLNFEASGLRISDITVTLNISGGWNGDLYAYLSHGSDYAVLLNRVGAFRSGDDGSSTSGLNVLLQAAITHSELADIHTIASPDSAPTAYAADGRVVYYDGSTRSQTLDAFVNTDPAGGWTLFFADQAAVNTSTLGGWSLQITAVPEPVGVALGWFAGVWLLFRLWTPRRGQ